MGAKNDRHPTGFRADARSSRETQEVLLYTWHPTEPQKKLLLERNMSLSDAISIVAGSVSQGNKFLCGLRVENDAFWAMMRQGSVDWDKARCVSVWHSDLDRAIIGLAFWLEVVCPNWPEQRPGSMQMEFDW